MTWPVLRIHDILVRICRYMPLTNGSGSGFRFRSCYYHHCLPDVNKKLIFLQKFFCIFTLWRYIYIFFQKSQKKSQNSRNQDFSPYFLFVMEGYGSGSRRPKHVDPVDPDLDSDPQHWPWLQARCHVSVHNVLPDPRLGAGVPCLHHRDHICLVPGMKTGLCSF